VETCDSLQTGAMSVNDALLTVRKVLKNLADDGLIKIKDKESSTPLLTYVE